jgi:sugar phosphate isomerase/epimerase
VSTDEMVKPDWMDDVQAHDVMRYTLRKAELVAARHGVCVCVEPHGVFTKTSEGLLRIVELVPSPWIQVNWDTGNAYLAGVEDPYQALERVLDRVYHVHAKDISIEHGERERGKVTGTPVGCACGEGVVDWERVLRAMDALDREITLSVECGTIDEAERSLQYLTGVIGDRMVQGVVPVPA